MNTDDLEDRILFLEERIETQSKTIQHYQDSASRSLTDITEYKFKVLELEERIKSLLKIDFDRCKLADYQAERIKELEAEIKSSLSRACTMADALKGTAGFLRQWKSSINEGREEPYEGAEEEFESEANTLEWITTWWIQKLNEPRWDKNAPNPLSDEDLKGIASFCTPTQGSNSSNG